MEHVTGNKACSAQVAVTFVPAPSFILFGQLATSAAFVQVTTLFTHFVIFCS